MKIKLLLLVFLAGLLGCSDPTELKVMDMAKPGDEFARGFIRTLIAGQVDSCLEEVPPEGRTDTSKNYLKTVSRNIKDANVVSIKLADQNAMFGVDSKIGKYASYNLAYEYEFDHGYYLFTIRVIKKNNRFFVVDFTGSNIQAPLSELTKFTMEYRSPAQYIFLIIVILVPLFKLVTLTIMLRSKMTKRKKIIWTLIIVLVAFPKFFMNWGNNQTDFQVLNIGFTGSGIFKPNLYSYWVLFFNFPVGAILFWARRSKLLAPTVPVEEHLLEDDADYMPPSGGTEDVSPQDLTEYDEDHR
jgi:hypothetical protein